MVLMHTIPISGDRGSWMGIRGQIGLYNIARNPVSAATKRNK